MESRLFTPRTATELLSVLRPAVREMRRLLRAMDLVRAGAGDPEAPVHRLYFRLLVRFEQVASGIRDTGAVVQDPRLGLVDFPARLDGKNVWLCWRAGEPTVAWWHEEGGPVVERRPVGAEAPWERAGS